MKVTIGFEHVWLSWCYLHFLTLANFVFEQLESILVSYFQVFGKLKSVLQQGIAI